MANIPRWAEKIVQKALKTRRVLIVSGARQVGKTTLVEGVSAKNSLFRTLDDDTTLNLALDDPSGFLTHSSQTMIIDEIQKAPNLISQIKRVVDRNNATGQFILTGSVDIKSKPEIKESLAGRVKNIRLRTLTEGEINGTMPRFLDRLFSNDFPDQIRGCSKDKILEIALRGGYPEIIRLDKVDRKDWYRDYLNTLLQHDLRSLSNIRRVLQLERLVQIVAAFSSKYINIDSICSALELSKNTIYSYLNLLEGLYLCERVPAWIKRDYQNVVKKDKFYFSDTGLMSSVLNWNFNDVQLDPDKSGKIVETFVCNELKAQIDLYSDYTLYHYRDSSKREIDFIIEDDAGSVACIEVKAGSSISKKAFAHMEWFKNNLVKDKRFIGIVLYSGENTLRFSEDKLAVPTQILWYDL